MALFMQDERPPEDLGPPAEGKKWVKVVEVVDGHDVEKWVQVDFGEPVAIDQVVVAGADEYGFADFGFPISNR